MSYLLIATVSDKKSDSYKILYFMEEKDRIRKICQSLELLRTERLEKSLISNLNLSSASEHHQKIFKDAFDLLRKKFPGRGTLEDWEDDEGLGEMLEPSNLIDDNAFTKIRKSLPLRYRDKNWIRLFSTAVDGTSLLTFYRNLEDKGPTVLLIQDTGGYVFGGFASVEWAVHDRFFGTGECFLFSTLPKFACYKWTRANDYFMHATPKSISMGGGGTCRYGFYLDSQLHWGTSETSNTYFNRCLSCTEEFLCTILEVWGFTN